MPEIREEDLVALYSQIEKGESKQSELEYIVKYKSKELDKSNTVKGILTWVIIAVIAINIGTFGYLIYKDSSDGKLTEALIDKANTAEEKSEFLKEEAVLGNDEKARIVTVAGDTLSPQEKESLQEVKEFYLAKNLLESEKIYTVQIAAISSETHDISLISENLSNHRIYKNNGYFKFSLGIFETLQEAQEFRKILIESGFKKEIFVISYKNGRRLNIEPS